MLYKNKLNFTHRFVRFQSRVNKRIFSRAQFIMFVIAFSSGSCFIRKNVVSFTSKENHKIEFVFKIVFSQLRSNNNEREKLRKIVSWLFHQTRQ